MKVSDRDLMWRATSELGDWFSRLGGANRYFNMVESEIFLYVACKTLDQHAGSFFVDEYVHQRLLEHGQKPIMKANAYISEISARELELRDGVLDYLFHCDRKLRKANEISNRWEAFLRRVGERNS